MRNRSYQLRARRGGFVPVGEVLQTLVDAADQNRPISRPAEKPPHILGTREMADFRTSKSGKLRGVQLELFHVEHSEVMASVVPDPDRPLFDLIPEAYQ